MALYQATRNVDLTKTETELSNHIRKATSIEETAPKRKHVRACIVYTWDHKNSGSFWQGMKVYVGLPGAWQWAARPLNCLPETSNGPRGHS